MSAIYARGNREPTAIGGVVLVAISLLAAVLVVAGLIYAAGTSERHKANLAAAGCEPNLSPSGLQCTTVQMLTSQYLSVTAPVLQQLRTDGAAYTASEGHHLAAAEAALTAEVTVENAFGKSLARFPFPPATAAEAKALIQANSTRSKLTAEQARSSSLAQLRSFNERLRAASAAVRTDIKLVSKALSVPPTANQEP